MVFVNWISVLIGITHLEAPTGRRRRRWPRCWALCGTGCTSRGATGRWRTFWRGSLCTCRVWWRRRGARWTAMTREACGWVWRTRVRPRTGGRCVWSRRSVAPGRSIRTIPGPRSEICSSSECLEVGVTGRTFWTQTQTQTQTRNATRSRFGI